MFVLAHLSDPHLPTARGVNPARLLNKRAFGLANWRMRRVLVHRPEILALLIEDLRAAAPDHVAVTGDLVNVSLQQEFTHAAQWLGLLGAPAELSVVPGNHDAYVRVSWPRSLARWQSYLAGDDTPADAGAATFPFVRRRGEVAIIGLSTAQPSWPGLSWGELGARQRDALARRLAALRGHCFRVVLLHHPPRDATVEPQKRLRDAAQFLDVLLSEGAELVLHGHNHRFDFGFVDGRDDRIPVIGVPSASAAPGFGAAAAQYHLYRIAGDPDAWSLDIRRRTFEEPQPQPQLPAAATGAGASGEPCFCEHAVEVLRLVRPRPASG
jgi:3',5'-cyclic AMP phosphodiesterase CpdA